MGIRRKTTRVETDADGEWHVERDVASGVEVRVLKTPSAKHEQDRAALAAAEDAAKAADDKAEADARAALATQINEANTVAECRVLLRMYARRLGWID